MAAYSQRLRLHCMAAIVYNKYSDARHTAIFYGQAAVAGCDAAYVDWRYRPTALTYCWLAMLSHVSCCCQAAALLPLCIEVIINVSSILHYFIGLMPQTYLLV